MIQEILITPQIAKEYLKNNTDNRRLNLENVKRYAHDMSTNNWMKNTFELIQISKSGKVLNGQHRLHAVIVANKSVLFHVVSGLEDDIFHVLDTGSSRNSTDIFFIKKVKNSNSIPSIIQNYKVMKLSVYRTGTKNDRFTNSELIINYDERPLFWQHIATKSITWYTQFSKILSPSYIGGLYSVLLEINSDMAEEFMNQLCSGQNIQNSTIGLLRKKLFDDKLSQKKITLKTKHALVTKTWNCYLLKKEPKLLKFDEKVEETPKILGL